MEWNHTLKILQQAAQMGVDITEVVRALSSEEGYVNLRSSSGTMFTVRYGAQGSEFFALGTFGLYGMNN